MKIFLRISCFTEHQKPPIFQSFSCTLFCIHILCIGLDPLILFHFLCDILHRYRSSAAALGVERPSGCPLLSVTRKTLQASPNSDSPLTPDCSITKMCVTGKTQMLKNNPNSITREKHNCFAKYQNVFLLCVHGRFTLTLKK